MPKTSTTLVGVLCFLLGIGALIQSATAQAPAAKAPAGPPLRISKLSGVGTRAKVETPRYTTTVSRGVKPVGLWQQIICRYEIGRTRTEWLDDLMFRYYVLSMKRAKKGNVYVLYKKNVSYVDIAVGSRTTDHSSTVYLRPAAMKRYGEVVAIAVEILYQGKVIAESADVDSGAKLPAGKWWKNPNIVESKVVSVKEGYLLDRSESPFALVNTDDYEVVK